MFKTIIVPALTGLAIIAVPATSFAGQSKSNNVVKVAVDDLDLSTQQGATEMNKRVRSATYKACMFAGKNQIVSPAEHNACIRDVRTNNNAQMAQKIAHARFGG